MTPVPYVVEAFKNAEDGRFYGSVKYGTNVVATAPEGGFKDENALEKWARGISLDHKDSISPPDRHLVTKSFVL